MQEEIEILVGNLDLVSRHYAERYGSDALLIDIEWRRVALLPGIVVFEDSDEAEPPDQSEETTVSTELRP